MKKTEIIFGQEEVDATAAKILEQFPDERIFFFKGELGAGKTTLIKALCKKLGVKSGLSSPTFAIVNEYESENKTTVYHADLYRLKNIIEAKSIGLDEYLNSGNYCFIEWPELIEPYLEGVCVEIFREDDSLRKMIIFSPL